MAIFVYAVPTGRQGPRVDLGEVRFHSGWTFREAGANRGTTPCSVMKVINVDAAMKLLSVRNPVQANDRDDRCPGTRDGEVIGTRKNPVIWQRA